MKKIQSASYGVASKVVHTASMSVDRVQGYFRGAVASWLQLHDAKTLPANGAVPIKSFLQPVTSAFHWGFDPGEVVCNNGLVVVMSTTEGTLTASAETSDFLVDGESSWDDTGATTFGSYSNATQQFLIWGQASGPKRLMRLEFTAMTGAGSVIYAKIYPWDALSAGDKPLVQIPLTIGTSKDVFFDFVPFGSAPISHGAGVDQNVSGCLVLLDSTPGVAVGSYAGTDFSCKGTYKTA